MQHFELAKTVHNQLFKNNRKLAIAESCTGGLLMAYLTQFSGASDYLLGGVVAYSNELKLDLLHVSPSVLQLHGAVSRETVCEMVKGLFAVTKADIAIAVSGIFGPNGGSKEKPVGTVWVAIGKREDPVKSYLVPMIEGLNRLEYRECVTKYLLEALWNL
jgi:PncC family amidohydrolase